MQEELGKSQEDCSQNSAIVTSTFTPLTRSQMDEMKESKRLAAEEKRKNAKPWF
jgi:hypothetical protein